MKILHILKTPPDEDTKTLINIISKGEENTSYELFREDADYEKLLDLIFDNDRVISWW
ncbi:MAG: hypothetical protein JRI79_15170 [Deltaproteobacteria bacterium]|nr:hypothetical protein [Deltaproteobacteria bacterium]MBW2301870.1 hypothetical protein [Deltaproteobacteria bacterium]